MKLRLALAAMAATGAAATIAHAAPVGATATAQVDIVAPNKVAVTRNLQFGAIAKPTSGTTTVTVPSAATGAATPILSGGDAFLPNTGQAHAATFHLTGTADQVYAITANTLAFPGAGANLTGIGAEAPVAQSGTLNKLPGTGQDDLHIGGHFEITPTTAVATYNGTLSITVNFN